jgi:hypothetical protein
MNPKKNSKRTQTRKICLHRKSAGKVQMKCKNSTITVFVGYLVLGFCFCFSSSLLSPANKIAINQNDIPLYRLPRGIRQEIKNQEKEKCNPKNSSSTSIRSFFMIVCVFFSSLQ